MMAIPTDPIILMSYLNTQLRDFYPSLTDWCQAEDLCESEIRKKLAAVGYVYDAQRNQFIAASCAE